MPALSQNLTFTINSSTTVALDYPNTGTTALTYFSDIAKGEGYYGSSDGLHTVQFQINNFVGTIEMQATIASQPTTNDWFTITLGSTNLNLSNPNNSSFSIDTSGGISEYINVSSLTYTQPNSSISILNFIGNYTWIRAKVSNFQQGTVSSIKYNF